METGLGSAGRVIKAANGDEILRAVAVGGASPPASRPQQNKIEEAASVVLVRLFHVPSSSWRKRGG